MGGRQRVKKIKCHPHWLCPLILQLFPSGSGAPDVRGGTASGNGGQASSAPVAEDSCGASSVAGLGPGSLGRGWGMMLLLAHPSPQRRWGSPGAPLPLLESCGELLKTRIPPASWQVQELQTKLGARSTPRRQEEPGSEGDSRPSCQRPDFRIGRLPTASKSIPHFPFCTFTVGV